MPLQYLKFTNIFPSIIYIANVQFRQGCPIWQNIKNSINTFPIQQKALFYIILLRLLSNYEQEYMKQNHCK